MPPPTAPPMVAVPDDEPEGAAVDGVVTVLLVDVVSVASIDVVVVNVDGGVVTSGAIVPAVVNTCMPVGADAVFVIDPFDGAIKRSHLSEVIVHSLLQRKKYACMPMTQ